MEVPSKMQWRVGWEHVVGMVLSADAAQDRSEVHCCAAFRSLVADEQQPDRDRQLLRLCRAEAYAGNPVAIANLAWMTLYGIGQEYAPAEEVAREEALEREAHEAAGLVYDEWDLGAHVSPYDPHENAETAAALFQLAVDIATKREGAAAAVVSTNPGGVNGAGVDAGAVCPGERHGRAIVASNAGVFRCLYGDGDVRDLETAAAASPDTLLAQANMWYARAVVRFGCAFAKGVHTLAKPMFDVLHCVAQTFARHHCPEAANLDLDNPKWYLEFPQRSRAAVVLAADRRNRLDATQSSCDAQIGRGIPARWIAQLVSEMNWVVHKVCGPPHEASSAAAARCGEPHDIFEAFRAFEAFRTFPARSRLAERAIVAGSVKALADLTTKQLSEWNSMFIWRSARHSQECIRGNCAAWEPVVRAGSLEALVSLAHEWICDVSSSAIALVWVKRAVAAGHLQTLFVWWRTTLPEREPGLPNEPESLHEKLSRLVRVVSWFANRSGTRFPLSPKVTRAMAIIHFHGFPFWPNEAVSSAIYGYDSVSGVVGTTCSVDEHQDVSHPFQRHILRGLEWSTDRDELPKCRESPEAIEHVSKLRLPHLGYITDVDR